MSELEPAFQAPPGGPAAEDAVGPVGGRVVGLRRAATSRSESAARKIESAVDQLREQRLRVTPTAVQALTGCSRTTINRNDKARLAILADKQLGDGPALPLAARATEDSWRTRALNAEAAARDLRAQLRDAETSIAELVDQLRTERARTGRRSSKSDTQPTDRRTTDGV